MFEVDQSLNNFNGLYKHTNGIISLFNSVTMYINEQQIVSYLRMYNMLYMIKIHKCHNNHKLRCMQCMYTIRAYILLTFRFFF